MTDGQLEQKIEKLLQNDPGMTARQLGAELGVYKGDINSCLYNSSKFVKDDSPRPCWYLSQTDTKKTPQKRETKRATTATKFRKVTTFDFSSLRPWQTAALQAWNENKRCGLVEAVTGTGKTRLAVAAIAQELEFGGKAAVIGPTIELQRQWFIELERQFPQAQIGLMGNGNQDLLTGCDVLIAIVHSASMHARGLQAQELGLLVADHANADSSSSSDVLSFFGRRSPKAA